MMVSLDPPLHERVYAGLMADYLAGVFVPGKRIDLQDLADRHRSSKTPVREAAFILVGEGLFRHHADGGFVVPILDRHDLIELHEWHLQVVLATAVNLDEAVIRNILRQFPSIDPASSAVTVATHASDFFTTLAASNGSSLATAEVRRLNDRLHYFRIADFVDTKMACRELKILTNPSGVDVHKTMRRRLVAYHGRRIGRLKQSST